MTGLAYHLGERERLTCPREEAVEVAARRLGRDLDAAEEVIAACGRHGLLAGGSEVWFAPHQTVQEHFAALALQEIAEREWAMGRWQRIKRGARQLLRGEEKRLTALADEDRWMEAFIQLAGLVDDADRLVQEVVRVNPWLAWWCVDEGRGVREKTREAVAERSVRLLASGQVADRRRAVATLAQIRSDRTIEPLFRAAADADEEVAVLAAVALVELGQAVREQALALAQRPEHPLHRSGLAYLRELLGLSVVWVPPGPFLMGSDKATDPLALDNEIPQREVTVPGYWIGRSNLSLG